MKRLIIALAIMLMATPCFAQLKPVNFFVGSGKGVLSAGLNASFEASDAYKGGEHKLNAAMDMSQIYALYQFDQVGPLDLIVSGGFFDNTPWCGPMLDVNITSWLYTSHWVGWSAGLIGEPEWQSDFFFGYNSIGADLSSHTSVYYALLHYQWSEPQHIVGASHKLQLNQKLQAVVGCDYNSYNGTTLFNAGFKLLL